MRTFSVWLLDMDELQKIHFGIDHEEMTLDRWRDYVTAMHSAAVCELTEMMDEIRWKPWDKHRGERPTEDEKLRIAGEAADFMHFFAHILNACGVDSDMLSDAIDRALDKNRARQAQAGGDDVHARKCPGCGRSLDDVGIKQLKGDQGAIAWMCQACNTLLREGEH